MKKDSCMQIKLTSFIMKRIRLPHLPGKVIYQANQMNQRSYLQRMVQFFLYICVCLAFEILVQSAKCVKENYIVGNPWSVLRRKIELKVSDNKNKTNISHPIYPSPLFLVHYGFEWPRSSAVTDCASNCVQTNKPEGIQPSQTDGEALR